MNPVLIYISGRDRDELAQRQDYHAWLKSLNQGGLVAIQEFIPPSEGIGRNVELWQYHICKVSPKDDNPRYLGLLRPAKDLALNGAVVNNLNRIHFHPVFPTRIVPIVPSLHLPKLGETVVSDRCLYEPLFRNAYRLLFQVPHGKTSAKTRMQVRKAYPLNYSLRIDGGYLITAFTQHIKPFPGTLGEAIAPYLKLRLPAEIN